MEVCGQRHGPAASRPRKRPGTHSTGGGVFPRNSLEGEENVAHTGIRHRNSPARSESLYRLSYRDPHYGNAVYTRRLTF
jgi:hypothetical protein